MSSARAFVAVSLLSLAATAVFAKDDAPRPPEPPNGTVWGQQCLADSRGQAHLGAVCCARLRDGCLQACSSAECKGPVEKCLEATTTCLDGCQRAYTSCLGLQPRSEPPPGGTRIEVPELEVTPLDGGEGQKPAGRTPQAEKP